jgi:hypothetical protein
MAKEGKRKHRCREGSARDFARAGLPLTSLPSSEAAGRWQLAVPIAASHQARRIQAEAVARALDIGKLEDGRRRAAPKAAPKKFSEMTPFSARTQQPEV